MFIDEERCKQKTLLEEVDEEGNAEAIEAFDNFTYVDDATKIYFGRLQFGLDSYWGEVLYEEGLLKKRN
ncbi:MAG: hypothetical protein LBP54_08630 [Campylobacteraceae bacterium]|jgi:hypothetical protein|nr:hypothetical protein [Campylobacteraceae bacterium]